MDKLLIATANRGKFDEIRVALNGMPFEIVSLLDLGVDTELEETEETYEGNALLKARHFSGLTGFPALADDSGIVVDALKGELGVKTRRWGAGEKATDEEWIDFFMKRMEEFSGEQRSAKFVSVVAFVDGQVEKTFLGETLGVITDELEAPLKVGIPLSSCFRHDGSDRVYSALSDEEKNRFSHRGKAVMEVRRWLEERVL